MDVNSYSTAPTIEIFVENFTTPNPSRFGVVYIPAIKGNAVGPGKVGYIDLPEGWKWTSVIALSIKDIILKIRKDLKIYTNDPNIIRIMSGDGMTPEIGKVRKVIEDTLNDLKLEITIEQRGEKFTSELMTLINNEKKYSTNH